jgi:hypothetical protein
VGFFFELRRGGTTRLLRCFCAAGVVRGAMRFIAKDRQSEKIREIGAALASVGYLTLSDQAQALGVCRSTTWTLVKSTHKASGLSAHLINQMLASPQLPQPVREKISEYVNERLEGKFGHSRVQLRKFACRLAVELQASAEVHEKLDPNGTGKEFRT